MENKIEMIPVKTESNGQVTVEPITLRDYFAGQALAGMQNYVHPEENYTWSSAIAAYKYADDMLRARGQ